MSDWRTNLLSDLRARYAELCVRERGRPYVEAYCLMTYAASLPEPGHTLTETLWNSRDGITPFCISTRDGQGTMQHVDFKRDRRAPTYRPPVGDRIFVDCMPEDALEHAERLVADAWDVTLANHYKTREDAIRSLAMGAYESGIPPRVAVVTEEMAKERQWL